LEIEFGQGATSVVPLSQADACGFSRWGSIVAWKDESSSIQKANLSG
jgi:hypothetical protein